MNRHSHSAPHTSKTAMMAAAHRHLSLFESNPGFSTQDTLAKIFLPKAWRFMMGFAWFRRYLHKKLHHRVPGTYPYVIARTKCFDEQFLSALQTDLPQIVILGAGYDTRAIRYQAQNRGSTIFELDRAELLKNKQTILKKNHIDIPENLTFCPIDFADDDLANVLDQAGFNSTFKTLFMWEGVSYYLTPAAVSNTLSIIKKHACVGSKLLFDYFYQALIDGHHNDYGAKEIETAVREVGEPFQFGIEPEKLASFLASFGFEIRSRYTPAELEKHYLTSHGELLGRVYGFAECICAMRQKQEHG